MSTTEKIEIALKDLKKRLSFTAPEALRAMIAETTLPLLEDALASSKETAALPLNRGRCGTCGRELGLHHNQHCQHWGQVLPSECPGVIDRALNVVLQGELAAATKERDTLRARVAELERELDSALRSLKESRESEAVALRSRDEALAEVERATKSFKDALAHVTSDRDQLRAQLDDARALCHGLGCGHCESCVGLAKADAARLSEALAGLMSLTRRIASGGERSLQRSSEWCDAEEAIARPWTHPSNTPEPAPSLNTPEPAPTGGGLEVWPALLAERVLSPKLAALCRERDALGRAKYGTPLMANNGRNALVDALQESLDLMAYLQQVSMEGGGRAASTRRLLGVSVDIAQQLLDLVEPKRVTEVSRG